MAFTQVHRITPQIIGLCVSLCLTNMSFGDESITTTQTTTTRVLYDSPVPPPAHQHEVITAEPSPAHVWVPGYWNREPNRWTWAAGHWEKPPFANARYVPGYWKYDASKYEWSPGHWATAPQGVVVSKPIPAPPTFYEPVPEPAAVVTNQVWVPGHWNWNGVSWVWTAGFYAVPPAPKVQWVAGHWREGLLGAYRWTPGHWASLP